MAPEAASGWERTVRAVRTVTVEPVLFLGMLAFGLGAPAFPALVQRKVCLAEFNYSVCDNLDNLTETHPAMIEDLKVATSRVMFLDSITYSLPILLVVFLHGAWGDTVSRKLPLAVCITSQALATISYALTAVFIDSSPYLILVGSLLSGLGGGTTTLFRSSFGYISTITSREDKSSRLAIAESFSKLAHMLAMFASGVILEHIGFVPMYTLVACINGLNFLYVVVRLEHKPKGADGELPESAVVTEKTVHNRSIFHSLCDLSNMKEALLISFKKREGRRRLYINLLVLASFLMGAFTVAYSVLFLFLTHPPVELSQVGYSFYTGYDSLVHFLTLILLIPLVKRVLHVQDGVLLILGFADLMISLLYLGASTSKLMVVFAPVIGAFTPCIGVATNAILANLSGPQDVGKVYALLGFASSVAYIFCNLLFTGLIFPLTVDVHPGFCILLSGLLQLLPLAIVGYLHIVMKKDSSLHSEKSTLTLSQKGRDFPHAYANSNCVPDNEDDNTSTLEQSTYL